MYVLGLTSWQVDSQHRRANTTNNTVMASGWGQGAGLAVGISSAVGMGLGNLVGALLSGVVAVPGVLVGSGVGAIHGPWYKVKDLVSGGGGDKENKESSEDVQAHLAIVDAARKLDQEGQDQEPSQVDKAAKQTTPPRSTSDAEKDKTAPTTKSD